MTLTLKAAKAVMSPAGRVSAVLALWSTFSSIYAQSPSAAPRVLQVGTFEGIPGSYATIQAAVNAANPGDWVLIAPGNYHEASDANNQQWPAGVWITTPGIHLRGMNRNTVVVNGTNPNPATCSSNSVDQNPGVNGNGRNGIEVFKVNGVTIENLTVCNFLGDTRSGGMVTMEAA